MSNNQELPVEDKQASAGTWSWTIILFALFVALLTYGFYLGNVFETFHNGSTL